MCIIIVDIKDEIYTSKLNKRSHLWLLYFAQPKIKDFFLYDKLLGPIIFLLHCDGYKKLYIHVCKITCYC